jgi:hypothetical protein
MTAVSEVLQLEPLIVTSVPVGPRLGVSESNRLVTVKVVDTEP